MSRPALELADIVRQHGAAYTRNHRLAREQLRILRAIEICRTATLGGHVEQCSQCKHTVTSYNSCRNRHCPKCQNTARRRWVESRKHQLLPVDYFHVVFTVPEQVARIALTNKKVVYGILFRTAAETLLRIARDPRHLGADIGFFAILHTWGQNLLHHPHVHCVVPGGGLSPDRQRWISCRPGFFLPVKVLSRLFRRLFLAQLDSALGSGKLQLFGELAALRQPPMWSALLSCLRRAEWVVYAKPPFGGAQQAIEYLGRYTHRVALSNDRLLEASNGEVSFRWKDYRCRDRHKSRVMTVSGEEFLRRFLLHSLPPGFQRIRHFGLLANRHQKQTTALCRRLLVCTVTELLPSRQQLHALDTPLHRAVACRQCGAGVMIVIGVLPAYRWPARPPDTS
jgi:hypothetical protein